MEVVERLLSSYPDYGKAPETYLASVAELVAGYDSAMQTEMLDLRQGIRAKCTYLPTIADIVKWGDDYLARRNQFKSQPSREPYFRPTEDDLRRELARKTIEPWENRVYPIDRGETMKASSPHKAPGKPWGVKPEGYWTRWTPEQRMEFDRNEARP